jgi:hypothetical protein
MRRLPVPLLSLCVFYFYVNSIINSTLLAIQSFTQTLTVHYAQVLLPLAPTMFD